jgi:hypothetical protein
MELQAMERAHARTRGSLTFIDANRAGEQHLHRDRLSFEGTKPKQLGGGWLHSLGSTKNGLSQKQVIYLRSQSYRCLIAVGDKPDQQVGSISFGIPENPNTSAGNEKAGDAMWRKHGCGRACCIEITRKHGDLWVFNDVANGRQKTWVGGELVALYHKPQAVADGASSTSTICIDLRATNLEDAMSYIKAACISIAQNVAAGEAPPRKEPDDGDGDWLRPKEGDGPL